MSASPDDSFPVDEFQTDTVIFHFVPDKKMFWADYRENRKSIEALSQLIKEHKEAIIAGKDLQIGQGHGPLWHFVERSMP